MIDIAKARDGGQLHSDLVDYQLRQALDNEQRVDVSMIPDIAVMALPTDVKRTCLAISRRLQDQGIDDDPVLRLKRTVKVREVMKSGKGRYTKGLRHDN